ncbi:hypothetical protein ACOMHN_023417 [Nucella lapillus]
MVHFFARSSRSRVNPDIMLQSRDRSGRPGGTSSTVVHHTLASSNTAGGDDSGGGGGGGSGNKTGRLGSGGGGGGLCLLSRLGQYKRRQHEQQKRRVAEKELDTLHQRIDKLLAKMEERDVDTLLDEDEECVVCLGARATMQTFPCEHRVVCRKCFIRTIQVAVAQRALPLRCVVCRERILKLRHSASGSKAVSVSTKYPFRSSSTPPVVDSLSPVSEGFILNNNNNNDDIASSKSHGVSTLGKVAPCCTQDGVKDRKCPSSSAFIRDPPRVTLIKTTARPFSPLGKAGHVTRTETSPSPMTRSTPGKSAKTSVNARSLSAKLDTRNKQGDVIGEAPPAASKGSKSQPSRRGKMFHFKPLFWRQ